MSVRRLAVFGTLQVAVAVFSSAQVITFSVKTEEVRVDALVTDHGKPALDLKPGDFEVIDNGVTQQIEFVSFEEIPICSVLALDMSASVAGGRLDKLKDAGTAFLDALRKDESAALVTFSSFVSLRCPFSTDAGMVKAALREAKPAGATSLIDGSYAGLELAESGAGRPLLILFSDGLDTSSWLTRQMRIPMIVDSDSE